MGRRIIVIAIVSTPHNVRSHEAKEYSMKIDIHCKGMQLTDAIRTHVEDRLGKLDRVLPEGHDPLVILTYEASNQDGNYAAEISMRLWNHDLVSKSTNDDLYKAVTEVADQVTKQVRRLKDKRDDRRKSGDSVRNLDAGTNLDINAQADNSEEEKN